MQLVALLCTLSMATMGDFENVNSKDKPVLNNANNKDNPSSGDYHESVVLEPSVEPSLG